MIAVNVFSVAAPARAPVTNRLAIALTLVAAVATAHVTHAQSPASATSAEHLPHPLAQRLGHGDALYLGEGGTQFFAIATDSETATAQGGVILIPDASTHPNWPRVIRPLRTGLPAHGWTTLAIEMPPLTGLNDLQPLQPEIDARMNAAIAHLHSSGINNIALVGHGIGASAALSYLLRAPRERNAQALVAIGIRLTETHPEHPYTIDLLEGMTVPILDIYGSRDMDAVLQTTAARRLAAKTAATTAERERSVEFFKQATIAQTPYAKRQGNIIYRQQRVEGADHDFSGMSDVLVKRVAGWLARHATGVTLIPAAK